MVKTDTNKTTKTSSKAKAVKTEAKKEVENVAVKIDEANNNESPVKMDKTLKKILLYFAISWAAVVAILWIFSIWWDIDTEAILRTFATYLVLFLTILSISGVPKLYEKVKNYPELVSVGIWLLTISISIVGLLICVLIWDALDEDFVWRLIATIGMINFVMIVIIFSMDRWWSKSSI